MACADKMVEEIKPRQRLDHYLAQQYPDLSRAFLQKLCNSEQVLVNGHPQKSGYKLRPNEKVEVLYDMASIDKIASIDLPIIYEDDDVLVINKPAGVIAHARGRYWNEPSVASFAREKTGQSGERAGIVHRLDRATSGLMIIAKHQDALSWLQKQFAERKVQKTYTAVVTGYAEPLEAVIDIPIERNPKAPATFRPSNNGKPAKTHYTVLQHFGNYSLVELHPHTGRTHQLRVHMKYLGHPIVGDKLYDGEHADRMMLHATKLEIALPSGNTKNFETAVPNIFKSYLK